MGPLGGGVGPEADQAYRLCELLGLDPTQTTEIRIVIEAGTGAVVEWSGKRAMPLQTIVEAMSGAIEEDDERQRSTPPAGKGGRWQVGPDPWAICPATCRSIEFQPGVWEDHRHECALLEGHLQRNADDEHRCRCGATWLFTRMDDADPTC